MAETNSHTQEGRSRRVELRLPERTAKLLNIVASTRDVSISELADEILIRSLPAMTAEVAALAG